MDAQHNTIGPHRKFDLAVCNLINTHSCHYVLAVLLSVIRPSAGFPTLPRAYSTTWLNRAATCRCKLAAGGYRVWEDWVSFGRLHQIDMPA